MRSAAEGSSGVMGAEGNPSLALKKSIDKGIQPNTAGRHVNYLEIYEPDVLADEIMMRRDLQHDPEKLQTFRISYASRQRDSERQRC